MKSTPIKAENYQAACQRIISCHQLSSGNQDFAYGYDDVALQIGRDTIGGVNVDWIQVGEEPACDVQVPEGVTYNLVTHVTSAKEDIYSLSTVTNSQEVILNFHQDDSTPLTFTLADEESEKTVML
ncbi:MAG: hypothetical protein WA919_14490 [Coleofasciculaceae cyanobacterium]